MKEFIKLAGLMTKWPWAKLCYGLSIFLLYEHIVSFSEAVALMLIPLLLDRTVQKPR